ncbi:MAG: Mut7-C RNAse domain-containing protein [Desulfovermiculus sp.]
MPACTLCFHRELTEFLPASTTDGIIRYELNRRSSIKDIVESLGPPHTEIGKIRVHNQPVDFGFIPEPGQTIHLHPLLPPVNPCLPSLLRPHPLPELRFIVDVNVGKVAKLLRMLGLDAAFHFSWRDEQIADKADREGRIALSKDRGLLKRKQIMWGRLVRGHTPNEQFLDVMNFFEIHPPFAIFSRCLACNMTLEPVAKKDIEYRLKPKTRLYYHRFYLCPQCQRIYWRGSHYQRMQSWLQKILPQITRSAPE